MALEDADRLDVLFAGGIHDARSAAAVAAAVAPLAALGARLGVLMGTAYVFTEEAVRSGAVSPVFQQEALGCRSTALLETSPGHAVRCADSPFVATFAETRARLQESGTAAADVWAELEQLNLGRLRIASKGLVHGGGRVSEDDQRADVMFMIGQVATLREEVTTIDALHRDVTEGADSFLRSCVPVLATEERSNELDVAIVGMAALFPWRPRRRGVLGQRRGRPGGCDRGSAGALGCRPPHHAGRATRRGSWFPRTRRR